jgi:hypothetical protein
MAPTELCLSGTLSQAAAEEIVSGGCVHQKPQKYHKLRMIEYLLGSSNYQVVTPSAQCL